MSPKCLKEKAAKAIRKAKAAAASAARAAKRAAEATARASKRAAEAAARAAIRAGQAAARAVQRYNDASRRFASGPAGQKIAACWANGVFAYNASGILTPPWAKAWAAFVGCLEGMAGPR